MNIIIKKDRVHFEDKSKIVREEPVTKIERIVHFLTGNPVQANDHDFFVFDFGHELWVPASIDFDGDLNDLESWSNELKIKFETRHQDYPHKAFWKKRLWIKYASVSSGIYSTDQDPII